MEEKKDFKNTIIAIQFIVIIILLIFVIVLLLTNNKSENHSEVTVATNNKEDSSITISKKDEQSSGNTIKINLNETVTKDGKYELIILGTNFAKTILPPNTSSFYTYYEAKAEGHQYLEVKYNYKNLAEANVRADSILSMTIKYDNKYEYTGFCVIEDSDNDFTYANITSIAPLTTGNLHYLFDIPDEVANGAGSIVAKIKCGNDTYEIVLR